MSFCAKCGCPRDVPKRRVCKACISATRKLEYKNRYDNDPEYRAVLLKRAAEYRSTEQGHQKRLQIQREYRKTDKGRRSSNESTLKWQKRYPDRAAAKQRRWYHAGGKKTVMTTQNRRRAVKKSGIPSELSKDHWQSCLVLFDYCCAYCGQKFEALHREHVIPIHRGGLDAVDNIVPACASCNKSKGAKFILEWVWSNPSKFISLGL